MHIECTTCGHREEVNKHLVLKIIGAAFAGGGFWAWVTFFFAGTGLALPICIALVTGGVALAAFANEIAAWVSKEYHCPNCGQRTWKVIQ